MSNLVRRIVGVAAIFFGVSVPGGLLLGVTLRSGDALAYTCVCLGLSIAASMWWLLSQRQHFLRPMNGLGLVGLCLISGLAAYSNLAYIIWICGFPLSIGTVNNGKMAENFWLPPATLLYAVFMYYSLKRISKVD